MHAFSQSITSFIDFIIYLQKNAKYRSSACCLFWNK